MASPTDGARRPPMSTERPPLHRSGRKTCLRLKYRDVARVDESVCPPLLVTSPRFFRPQQNSNRFSSTVRANMAKRFKNFHQPGPSRDLSLEDPQEPSTSSGLQKRMAVRNSKNGYLEPGDFPFCADASKYQKLMKIGHGSFGEVYKARAVNNPSNIVAMKTIVVEDGGVAVCTFPKTSLREIRTLQFMKNDNVVRLIDFCRSKRSYNPYTKTFQIVYYLVFEYCEHDLAGLLSNKHIRLHLSDIKEMLKQLLNGLYYIHKNSILHRDFKSANILISKRGLIKLADFGLSRTMDEKKTDEPNNFTNRVVTLWFRPPELLLGECNYGTEVDLWGFGCVMAEMWTRCPIFQGISEATQLFLICQLCGSITPEVWPDVVSLDLYNKIELPKGIPRKVKDVLGSYINDPDACSLVDAFLALDPKKRINADAALNHSFFWKDPMPSKPEGLARMLSKLHANYFEYLIAHPSMLAAQQFASGCNSSDSSTSPDN